MSCLVLSIHYFCLFILFSLGYNYLKLVTIIQNYITTIQNQRKFQCFAAEKEIDDGQCLYCKLQLYRNTKYSNLVENKSSIVIHVCKTTKLFTQLKGAFIAQVDTCMLQWRHIIKFFIIFTIGAENTLNYWEYCTVLAFLSRVNFMFFFIREWSYTTQK